MQIKCSYCGNFIEESDEKCPYCGAPNEGIKRTVTGTPHTIEELKAFVGDGAQKFCTGFGGGSSDQGDVSSLIPSIQSYFAGVTGGLHANNFCMVDKELTMITSAKAMLCLVIELLYGGAEKGKKVKEDFKPVLTKEEYLRDWGRME